MHPSANTPLDGLPPPPISAVHHHGAAQENGSNGRSSSLLACGGESKPSSSSYPPKSQEFCSVSFSNLSPNNGNPTPAQAQQKHQHQQQQQQQDHESRSGKNPSPSADVFLQWGQKKRSKRSVGDKFSGGRTMPPPPPSPGVGGKGGTKLRNNTNSGFSSKENSSSSLRNRNLEDGGRMGSGKRSENSDAKKAAAPCAASFGGGGGGGGGSISIRKDKPTESLVHHQSDQQHLTSPAAEAETHTGKGGGEVVEWPRIYIALSRKEKDDDFFTMKGTKLPHRPKKRAKAIDRTLQYCFPGMWLSELSRARYEVRERKSVKKQPRRRGLKGLDSMESESD